MVRPVAAPSRTAPGGPTGKGPRRSPPPGREAPDRSTRRKTMAFFSKDAKNKNQTAEAAIQRAYKSVPETGDPQNQYDAENAADNTANEIREIFGRKSKDSDNKKGGKKGKKG
jgi:hypothetical protein